MGVTAVEMDVVTEKSGHTITPMAVSVCITPMVPPTPLPYPVVASVSEGISDTPMRTKIEGVGFATTGSVLKTCHGNEPGTLKEVVSLNTTGPVFPIVGAPTVLSELGMISITGSPCVSNKAPTPGAGGNASDAGGSSSKGGGSGTDGSGDGKDKEADNEKGGGGADGDGTSSGASATPATPQKQNEYCPDASKKAPPPFEQSVHDVDLRNHYADIKKHGTKDEKLAAEMAMDGNAAGKSGYAFWSGGGRGAAGAAGFKVQEDEEGAGGLEKMGKQGKLPTQWDDKKTPSASKVTGERLWKTISKRSAENAQGDVNAFVKGGAHRDNVFSTTELPTLLHNDKVKSIKFHAPEQSWKRADPSPDCPAGKWSGDPVDGRPNSGKPGDGGGTFSLHPTEGISWHPPRPT